MGISSIIDASSDITEEDVKDMRAAADSLEKLNGERFGISPSGIIGTEALRNRTKSLREIADRLESRMTLKL